MVQCVSSSVHALMLRYQRGGDIFKNSTHTYTRADPEPEQLGPTDNEISDKINKALSVMLSDNSALNYRHDTIISDISIFNSLINPNCKTFTEVYPVIP